MDPLVDAINKFEAEIDKSSKMLVEDPKAYPPPNGAILAAGLMVAKAVILLARTNLRLS